MSSALTNYFVRSTPFFRKSQQIHPSSPFMGRRTCAPSFATYARAVAPRIYHARKNSPSKPKSKPVISLPSQPPAASSAGLRGRRMENLVARAERVPLSVVVSDCVKRWFQETLKAASAGDISMQILVAQMYQSGYGIAKNELQAKKWIREASKYRSSALKDSDKHPGYNGSDSDSDKVEDNDKQ
ncbi:uncharacterized protein LOC144556003 [Carex rostrata]